MWSARHRKAVAIGWVLIVVVALAACSTIEANTDALIRRPPARPARLAVACDMPFLSVDLLRHLVGERADVDAVVPSLKGQLEPLHALYSKACLAPMQRRLQAVDLKIASLFEAIRVRYVDEGTIDRIDPRHLSFFNINTRAQLEEARRLAQEVDSPQR